MKTRDEIVADIRRLYAECDQYLTDAASYMENNPHAAMIPTGRVRRIADECSRFLEHENETQPAVDEAASEQGSI